MLYTCSVPLTDGDAFDALMFYNDKSQKLDARSKFYLDDIYQPAFRPKCSTFIFDFFLTILVAS